MTPAEVLGGGPVQVAYGVPDVELAARRWAERCGAGPFYVRHHIPVNDVEVAGKPGVFDHSSAYGQWGSVMVELVTVHEPSGLTANGLHHLAYFVESVDQASAALTANGWPRALRASAGSTRFVFHDARPEFGHLIELYEPSDTLRGFYDMVAQSAIGWDGTGPVRSLG